VLNHAHVQKTALAKNVPYVSTRLGMHRFVASFIRLGRESEVCADLSLSLSVCVCVCVCACACVCVELVGKYTVTVVVCLLMTRPVIRGPAYSSPRLHPSSAAPLSVMNGISQTSEGRTKR